VHIEKEREMTYEQIMNKIMDEIEELEESIAECEFGSSSYDSLTAEVEYLYLKLDRLQKVEL